MKILTTHWPKPIPSNKYDWTAWVDGKEEWYVGYGSTEQEALDDLNNNIGYTVNDPENLP